MGWREGTCSQCGGPCDKASRSGKCRACWVKPREDRFCGCGTKLGRANRSGLCKVCVCVRNHTDPSLSAKRLAATLESNADPEARRRRAKACREACNRPEEIERRRRLGRRTHYRTIHGPKMSNAFTPEAIAKRKVSRRATMARTAEAREAARRSTDALVRFNQHDAAEYLRRRAPTYRCDDRGRAGGNTHWRHGMAVLAPAELIERALARGWSPA